MTKNENYKVMESDIKTLTITVDFSNGIEMEYNLNKAIDELSYVIKRKGLIDMTLEGKHAASLAAMYEVKIQDKSLTTNKLQSNE